MKLQSVQVLRGLAALLVVFYHTRAHELRGISLNGSTETAWLGGMVSNGFAGVDLFFVISGFIMVAVTNELRPGVRTTLDFMFGRLTRIYPVWWLFAGCATIGLIGYHSLNGLGETWQLTSRPEPDWVYIIKSFLLVPQPEEPILVVGWTLIHEVYFYAIFALILMFRKSVWPYLLLIWGAAIVGGWMAGLSGPRAVDFKSLAFFPMTMEFIFGATAAVLISSGMAWRGGIVTLLATLWLVAALCLQGAATDHTLQWGRVMMFGLPSAALIYGLVTLELDDRLAWLVPAGIGALTSILLFQLYGLGDDAPVQMRLSATLVCTLVGGFAMLATLWMGWLAGQNMPDAVRGLFPGLRAMLAGLVRLGDASYSLYLVHTLVIVALRVVFERLGHIPAIAPVFRVGHPGPLDNIAFTVACVAVSIIASLLTYRFFERPVGAMFRKLRKRLFGRPRPEPDTA